MKIADTQRELQAVLSIIKNAEKGNERISLKLLGDLHKEHFGYAPTQEIFNRIRRLTKNKKAIPTLAALQHDTALSEGARTILVDPPMKALKRESDIELLMDNLQDYYRLRLIRASQKDLAETFAKAKGIQDLDFEEITKGQSDLLQSMRGRGDTKKTLLFAGAKSNSEDLTEEILNDEDDLDTIFTGWDYLDKKTGGFRRGQLLVLAAHRKGGKCAHPDTLIETERGLIPIKDLFDGTEPEDTFVETRVKLAHRYGVTHTSQRLTKMHDGSVRIRSDRGYEFEGSKVHPVLVLDPKTKVLDYKKMADLRKGDCIVLNKPHHLFPKKPLKIEWMHRPTKYSAVELSCVHCEYKGKGLLNHLQKAHPGVNTAAYLRKHHPEYKRWPQRKEYAVTPRKVPSHMTEDLAKVLGYLVSEGHGARSLSYCSFTQLDKEVFQDFCSAFKRCFPDTPLQISTRQNCRVAYVRSSYVCQYLQQLGFAFSHSRDQDVPWSIMRSTRECVVAFLRAYYEGDGGFDKARIIAVTSASEKLIKNLQQLLLRFSVVSRRGDRLACATNGSRIKRKYHELMISKGHADTFMREIGFISARKNAPLRLPKYDTSDSVPMVSKIAHALKNKYAANGNKGIYVLPNGEHRRMMLQPPDMPECSAGWLKKHPALMENIAIYEPKFVEGIREILEQDFVLDPIVKIKRINKPIRLYDLSVPASHSYVANGMVVHNSICALNMAYNQYRKGNLSVCVLPLEMSQKEVRQRLLSKMTAIPFDRFYQKKLTDKDKKRVREAWADFEKYGKENACFFSTWKPETQPTVEDIVLQLKPYRYDVIVVDYVNLMRSSDPKQMGSNDWQMLSSFYKQLKEAASILNCLMVGLTQTNTETGGIKYSSAALEDCDCAITWKFLDAERAAHQLKAKIEVARHFEPFDFILTEDFKHMNVASYDSGPALASDRNAPDTSDFIL